ncbi:hypothetical protein CAEBREN_32494 [Caenorhabditis brenneri]|uniref:Uncharacterized protein n=1 Tax=Caenorhabditis brenneri TaxID=135651 RepID=G0NV95_CAEBE|nr:hypothetical protein CAEBREN_32494 [Caenorhabditis brenneri]
MRANHLREGTRPHTAIYRLSSTKTSVQVLCRQCQEVIPSSESLREHRHFPLAKQIWQCKVCNLEFETCTLAIGEYIVTISDSFSSITLIFVLLRSARGAG